DSYQEAPFPPTYQNGLSVLSFYATDHWKLTRRISLDFGSRFDHYAPVTPADNLGNAVWVPKQYQPGVTNAGVSWYSINHSISKAGVSADLIKFAPRFGASIDIFGTGKTVVRGGWGIYLSEN